MKFYHTINSIDVYAPISERVVVPGSFNKKRDNLIQKNCYLSIYVRFISLALHMSLRGGGGQASTSSPISIIDIY